jgi:hypothetical protein
LEDFTWLVETSFLPVWYSSSFSGTDLSSGLLLLRFFSTDSLMEFAGLADFFLNVTLLILGVKNDSP